MILQRFGRFLPLLAVLTSSAGCSETGPRVYTAQPYDSDAECLGEYEAIALVEADGLAASCPASCLELGGSLYVSSVCPPFPDSVTEIDPVDDAACAAALAAEACE